jgi:hypothetical protein
VRLQLIDAVRQDPDLNGNAATRVPLLLEQVKERLAMRNGSPQPAMAGSARP